MNILPQIKCPSAFAALGLALIFGVCWSPPLVAAEPEFVGVLALVVNDDEVAKELKLSDEVRQKLVQLVDRRENEAVELLYLPPQEQSEKLAAFRRESEAAGMQLLSPQQRDLLGRIHIRRMGRLASLADPAVGQRLNLTDAQRSRVAELLKQQDEQLKHADDQAARAIRADAEQKLSSVLTAEQQTAWEALFGRGTAPAPEPVAVAEPPAPDQPAEGQPAEGQPAEDQAADDQPAEPTEVAEDAPPDPADMGVDEPIDEPVDEPQETPGKLVFQFRYQPWKDVIEWFAEQADLSYVGDVAPQGTFNYTDRREYTPAEAIDLLNSVLLTKGYTLIRRDRMLMLINLEDGIPPNLVSTIPLEELDDKGEYELVSVLFNLQEVSAEEADEEIAKLIGPQGSVVTLPKSRQILVTETAGRLRAIRLVIQRIEDPEGLADEKMQSFEIKYALPDDVLTVVRQLMNIPEEGNATEDGSLRFALDPSGGKLLVTGTPEKLERLDEILKAVDLPGPGALEPGRIEEVPQLEVYSITTADPESVLAVMQTLLAGLPDVRLSLDPKTDNLVALARPTEQATIRATLDQMQQDARLIEVIYLTTVDPQMAVLSINKLFQAGGEDAAKNAPTIDADPTTRQLLVRGTATQIEQIRQLLEKMGESDAESPTATGTGNVRMLPLTGRAAQSALERIQRLWPTMRGNPIRVVTPSAVAPALRSGNAGELPNPEDSGAVSDELRPRLPALWRATPRSSTPEPEPQEPERSWRPPFGGRPSHDHDHDRPSRDNSTGLSYGARIFLAAQTVESVSLPPDPTPNTTPADQAPAGEAATAEPTAEPPAEPSAPSPAEPPPPAPAEPPAPSPAEPSGEAPPEETPAVAAPPVEPPAEEPVPEPQADQPQVPAAAPSLAPIIVAPGPGGLMIACEDVEVLNEFEALLTTLTESLANSDPELAIFYLKHATAAVVAQTLDQILGGGTIATEEGGGGGGLIGDLAGAALGDGIMGALLGLGGGGGVIAPTGAITITPDARLNALIVQANPIDLDMIEQVLKILDQKESPEEILVVPKTRMIPVYNTQAEEIASILRQVYQDRMVTSSQGSGGGRPPSPEDLMRLLRGSRGGSRGSQRQSEEKPKMSLGIDTRSNSLIVAAPEALLEEVEELVWQLDQAAVETTQAMRTVTLHGASPEAVQRALASMLGDSVQFSRSSSRSSGSSRPSSSSGSTRPSSSSSDDARRAFFMEMMRRRMEGGGGPPGGFSGRGGPPSGGSSDRGGPPGGGSSGRGGPPGR